MAYAATIGFFDGVHRGHQMVVRALLEAARQRGMQTMVVTFDNHPLSVVCPGKEPQLIISNEEKERKLLALGIDRVLSLHFTKEMMQQTAHDFMQELRDDYDVRLLMLGYDNRFGRRQPDEGFADYCRYGESLGVDVVEGPRPESAGLFEGRAISSSLVRELLAEGRTDEAEGLLFRV